jgi:pilus assembly protein CpaB
MRGWLAGAWEMRRQTRLLVSLLLGVLAVILMFLYIKGRETSLLQLSAMKDVLVASRSIRPNTIIDESMLISKQVPSAYLQPSALSDARAVVGRVAAVAIPQGAQILQVYLEETGRKALAADVPRSQRAVTLAVNEVTGTGGLIRPGNSVDIFGTFQFGRPVSTGAQGQMQYADQRTETRLLMQNVLVIAVGREQFGERPVPRRAPAAGITEEPAATAEDEQARRDRDVRNVTLIVGPRQAQELILAQDIGTLTLTLRSPLDEGTVVDLGMLDPLGLLKVPIPPIPKARAWWRELRGPN